MSARKTSSTALSKMQQTFMACSTLKRNRRYLDIERINLEEEHQNIKRRRPRNISRNGSVQNKINRSFSSSTAAYTERLGKDIHKFRNRINSQQRPKTTQSFYSDCQTPPSTQSIKGVGIGQHLSREEYYKVRSKPVHDERLFNNYTTQKPDTQHMADLGRGPERDFDNRHTHINIDIEYDTQKLYQDYYYKRTNMDTRLHYKKQKEEQRFFFVPKRQENKPSTDLSPKAVKKAAQTVEPKRNIDSFYMNSGRQLPCQFDQRVGTNLTSHWRNSQDQIERPRPEYSVRAMRQNLYDQRKERIIASKRPSFNRGQVCDKKFFIIKGQAC